MRLAAVVPAEGRTTGVTLSHMEKVLIRAAWGVTTVLTHKDFGPSLTVGILLMNTVNLPHMGLERATLCKGFFTQLTLVGTDTWGRQNTVLFLCIFVCMHYIQTDKSAFAVVWQILQPRTPCLRELFKSRLSTNNQMYTSRQKETCIKDCCWRIVFCTLNSILFI